MIISEKDYVSEFQEEIFQVKLLDNTLEELKNKILKNLSDKQLIYSWFVNDFKDTNPKLFNEINELERIHIKGLKEGEKLFLNKFLTI